MSCAFLATEQHAAPPHRAVRTLEPGRAGPGRGPRALPVAWVACSWAAARGWPGKAMGHSGTVRVGRIGTVQLCRSGFGPVTANLFFYLLNIFKSLQIQKFV
jgi:hypothetical protein